MQNKRGGITGKKRLTTSLVSSDRALSGGKLNPRLDPPMHVVVTGDILELQQSCLFLTETNQQPPRVAAACTG